ncbi:hypothetical protein A2V49_02780 [candidate division WWE3 bacterium RBG_19FT_COMBO_34_6]|uniref:Uncharacterized protein n=1 Tax=candidate division WWE3 bacterium RBG_19FT_COMBO_34_6 TaxID=1802612 RepID=A0A1F4UNA4_UNCKA|nr:MAG: hypothetical protein A2V49_02780 [candidate division WWE3 bacterium RBG_19FT_COMBO_34_6]
MQIIYTEGFQVPRGVKGYFIGTEKDVEEHPVVIGLRLKPIALKPPDSLTLLLWYKDPFNHDDDFKLFDVHEGEKVYAIVKSK